MFRLYAIKFRFLHSDLCDSEFESELLVQEIWTLMHGKAVGKSVRTGSLHRIRSSIHGEQSLLVGSGLLLGLNALRHLQPLIILILNFCYFFRITWYSLRLDLCKIKV